MSKPIKTVLIALAVLGSASSAFAATNSAQQPPVNAPWVQQIQLDASALATQYFQEMQRDGR